MGKRLKPSDRSFSVCAATFFAQRCTINGRTAVACRVLLATMFCSSCLAAAAQPARWNQLSEQVLQLRNQGRYSDALPLVQQAVTVAQSTFGAQDRHVALSLNELGLVLEELEKYADAENAFRRSLEIFAKVSGSQSEDVASQFNNLGNLYRIQARYTDAEKLLQQALQLHEKLRGPNDPEVATTASNLAVVFMAEAKYAEAEPLYRRAIAIDEKAQGVEPDEIATDFNNLADLYSKQGKYSDAEQLFLKAIGIDTRALGKDHPTVALRMANLATIYLNQGRYAAAEPLLLRAQSIDQATFGGGSAEVAFVLDRLGSDYQSQGRYQEAENAYQKALANREKVLGPDHPAVAETLVSLGSMYKNQGKWGQAEAMYRQAMTIDLKTLGKTHPGVAVVLNKMASLYVDESKLADAERFLRGALAINQAVYGPKHPVVAENLSSLAAVYGYEGKAANAEPMYQQALAIAEASLGPNHPDVAGDLIGLASDYADQQKYTQAEPLFHRALTIEEAALGPNHPDTGEALMNLATFYYGWDKPDQAEPFFDRRINNLMEQFRSNAAYMSEKDRLNFLATVPGAFPLFFSFALKYHDRNPDLAGKVYDSLLQEKGFIAASAAALRAKILASGDRDAIALLDKLTARKTELAGVVSSSQGDPADRRKVIAQLQQETNQLEQELVKRASAFSDQKTLAEATWHDVQKALKPGEAAVEFARFQFHNGKIFTSTIYYIALVVKPESKSPDFIVLGQAKELEAAPIAGYSAHVGVTRGIAAEPEPPEHAAPRAAAGNTSAAYDAFWKPLEPSLATTRRVFVSPDGVLNQVSMGLLADHSGKLLLEKYQLHFVNSTKDLLRTRRGAASKSAVLVGNPTFNLTEAQQRAAVAQLGLKGQQSPVVSAPSTAAVQSAQRSAGAPGAALNPLPGTQLEVNAVNKLLGASGWQVTAYTGDRALKEAVDAVRSPRLVHLATHGFFLSDQVIATRGHGASSQSAPIVDPMLRSGLFFAGADRTESGAGPVAGVSDGVLTAYEASQLDLQGTELVVLSACETGLGQQSNGEGVFGLRRGLQEAGADAVMMSMWSVPDQETQELMTLFYANWLRGLEKPEALREAQMKEREVVRQRYGKDLPFYWGAFVLVSR